MCEDVGYIFSTSEFNSDDANVIKRDKLEIYTVTDNNILNS